MPVCSRCKKGHQGPNQTCEKCLAIYTAERGAKKAASGRCTVNYCRGRLNAKGKCPLCIKRAEDAARKNAKEKGEYVNPARPRHYKDLRGPITNYLDDFDTIL